MSQLREEGKPAPGRPLHRDALVPPEPRPDLLPAPRPAQHLLPLHQLEEDPDPLADRRASPDQPVAGCAEPPRHRDAVVALVHAAVRRGLDPDPRLGRHPRRKPEEQRAGGLELDLQVW